MGMTHAEFADNLSRLIAEAHAELGGAIVLEILEEKAEYHRQLTDDNGDDPDLYRIGSLPSYLPGSASAGKPARLWYMRNDSTVINSAMFSPYDPIPWYNGPTITGEYTVHLEWTQGIGRQDGQEETEK